MTWEKSLLTTEATPWETAVEGTSAARWPLQWDLLRSLHNPDAIPEDKLPILAWALSVDLWDPSWPIEKKRSVVRSALRDHALKGTIAGVRRHLEIEDADLVEYKTPPQRLFVSRSLTKEEMDRWLQSMPQLRVYLQSKPGDGRGLAFVGDAFVGEDFATFDEAEAIYGRFPVLYDQGEVTPLKTSQVLVTREEKDATQVERLSLRGIGGHSFISHDFIRDAFVEETIKKASIYTIRTDRRYSHESSELFLSTATPGLEPVNIRYSRESEIGNAGPCAFIGDFLDRGFYLCDDEAEWMLYDLIYLHDTARAAPLVDALSFVGDRISMSPFHAEYMVDGNTRSDTVPKFEGDFIGHVYAAREDLSKIERQMDAVTVAKRYTEKALVTFETTRARTWGDGYPLDGSVPLWSRVEATL